MAIGSGYRFQFSGFPVTVGAVSNRTWLIPEAVHMFCNYWCVVYVLCVCHGSVREPNSPSSKRVFGVDSPFMVRQA